MFIYSFDPILERKDRIYLRYRAFMRCPVCKKGCHIETCGTALSYPLAGGLRITVDNEIKALFAERHCDECGVASIVPKNTREDLERNIVEKTVAGGWFEVEFEKLTNKNVNDSSFGTWMERKELGKGSHTRPL